MKGAGVEGGLDGRCVVVDCFDGWVEQKVVGNRRGRVKRRGCCGQGMRWMKGQSEIDMLAAAW